MWNLKAMAIRVLIFPFGSVEHRFFGTIYEVWIVVWEHHFLSDVEQMFLEMQGSAPHLLCVGYIAKYEAESEHLMFDVSDGEKTY